MTLWLTFILAIGAVAFGWAAYRGITRGTTNLPLKLIAIEEFDRDSIYFWGIVGFNVCASLGLTAAAVFAYVYDWGHITG